MLLVREIRDRYRTIVEEFPLSKSVLYYRDHVAGLEQVIMELGGDPEPRTEGL